MKRCPECRKDYFDDSLLYCLDDGAALVQGTVADEPATAILSGNRRSGEDLTATLKAGGTISRSGPVTLRLPSFLSWERLPWILVTVLALGLLVALVSAVRNSRDVRYNDLVKTTFYIQPPPRNAGQGQIAVSPDGKYIAVTASSEGRTYIWLRGIDSLEGRPLVGTDGVVGFPFWSADSRSMGFLGAGNKLKRIDLADGTVREIADVSGLGGVGFGGTWNREGTILLNGPAIVQVPASGGTPQVLPGYESQEGELPRWPSFLPDGKHFLFLVTSADRTKSEVFVGSTDGSQPKHLFVSDSNAVYSPAPGAKGGIYYLPVESLCSRMHSMRTPRRCQGSLFVWPTAFV